MASFPSSVKTFTTLVDAVDSVLAAHQNERGDEITAIETWLLNQAIPEGKMVNGKISVSVVSNDLVVAIKTLAGTDPSASDPVLININGNIRTITAATSCTLADGTNWFNSGGAELATQLVPYFAYAVWDSNSNVVAATIARKPHYRIVAASMSTTTSENHIYGYSGFTAGDNMANIGYFEATLSAGAGYTWTVPTFTNNNLRHEPTFESQVMTYTPTIVGFSGTPTVGVAVYQIKTNVVKVYIDNITGTSNATNFTITSPFSNTATSTAQGSSGYFENGGTAITGSGRISMASNNIINLFSNMASGTWTNSGTKTAYFNLEHKI